MCKETVAALFSLNPLGLHLKYFDAAAWLNIWAGAGGVFGIPEGVTECHVVGLRQAEDEPASSRGTTTTTTISSTSTTVKPIPICAVGTVSSLSGCAGQVRFW